MKGSVKIMRSYDYNHFEIALASDEDMDVKQINELRKKAQMLADEAVRQYIIAKSKESLRLNLKIEKKQLEKEIELIKEIKPQSEYTAQERAKIKALEDKNYWKQHNYFYDDDYDCEGDLL